MFIVGCCDFGRGVLSLQILIMWLWLLNNFASVTFKRQNSGVICIYLDKQMQKHILIH